MASIAVLGEEHVASASRVAKARIIYILEYIEHTVLLWEFCEFAAHSLSKGIRHTLEVCQANELRATMAAKCAMLLLLVWHMPC